MHIVFSVRCSIHQNHMTETFGILAGSGALPRLLAEHCAAHGLPYMLYFFSPAPPEWAAAHPHETGRLGAVGATLQALKERGVTSVIFAGGMQRPKLSALSPDALGLKLLSRLGFSQLKPQGDDHLLRTIAGFLEEQGFTVTSPHSLLGGALMPPRCLSKRQPAANETALIHLGLSALRHLGSLDIGQGVVVADNRLLAIEGVEGTDALLRRCAEYGFLGEKILIKAAKPEQDTRLDMPSIGAQTIENAAAAGFCGIAAAAGQTLLLEREAAIAAADAAALFLVGVPPL